MPTIAIDTSTDDSTLVAAPSQSMGVDRRIVILGLDLTAAGQVDVTLKSNSTTIWPTNSMDATTGGGIVLPISDDRDLMCSPGEALKIGLSAAVNVKGSITYVLR